jgi:glycosyltransferase involved in cell wall biosynthesis
MKISIVIPVYNAVNYICETIESWLGQTTTVYEIIIQDDKSNDGTWELLNSLYSSNKKIKLIRNDHNLGIGKNWNAAYENSTGNYVVIFNADDLVTSNFIAKSLEIFESNPKIDFVTHAYYNTFEKNIQNELAIYYHQKRGKIKNILTSQKDIKLKPHLNYTLIKRESLEDLKNNEKLFYETQVCDAMLWLEIYRKNKKGYFSGEILGYYRLHDNNNSSLPLGEFESTVLDMLPIYNHELNLIHPRTLISPLKSIIVYIYQVLKFKKKLKSKIILNLLKYGYSN